MRDGVAVTQEVQPLLKDADLGQASRGWALQMLLQEKIPPHCSFTSTTMNFKNFPISDIKKYYPVLR